MGLLRNLCVFQKHDTLPSGHSEHGSGQRVRDTSSQSRDNERRGILCKSVDCVPNNISSACNHPDWLSIIILADESNVSNV
jgi:hypothetical protein